jgi:hypothetical protein
MSISAPVTSAPLSPRYGSSRWTVTMTPTIAPEVFAA